ncbi:hypothetical protein DN069_03395 [Streptacidiphilus pinicola]|uniref:Uncharacterized protein n=1 Tax=Streptacidiphilus pinicola TaxID=2219663 RepID=A0A2X0IQW9_9ACTN|nr:hypothetical protein [Streptacidiphilus pinicola]RAG87017.1 hypothetical protein DN069_03395 [Streptacidiphilus pinicola]
MTTQLGDDAHYVDTTARLFGWLVDWQESGRLLLRRGEWVAQVHFSASRAFVRSLVHGPARESRELGLTETIKLLEREGFPVPRLGS